MLSAAMGVIIKRYERRMEVSGIKIVGRVSLKIVCVFAIASNLGLLTFAQSEGPSGTGVGLSLLFENASMKPLTFYGNPPRYLNEIDLVFSSLPQAIDSGSTPLVQTGDTAALDWKGVEMVDEDWRRTGDTFQRERFYRNAAWMNAASQFTVYATDAQGRRMGAPLIMTAGRDDQASDHDDGFIRRFVARQIATGCKKQGDCTGAQFVLQTLVQLRQNRNKASRTLVLPPQTAALELEWSEQPGARYRLAVKHAAADSLPFGYGFQISLDVSPPKNGRFFTPGEEVKLRPVFRDGQSRRLFEPGHLPTYGEVGRDDAVSGLSYYNGKINSTLYYALKHREANILVAISGPTNKLALAKSVLDGAKLQEEESVVANVASDGYSAVFTGLPSFAISLGPPAKADQPVSDIVSLHVPMDALPGTYIAAIKARRIFGGEALNRAAVTTFQVGTTESTEFAPKTGNCDGCHKGAAGFENILHGVSDRRACFACHIALSFEPDNALDVRVHSIHSRSRRFNADFQKCSVCHFAPPAGSARGMLARAGFRSTITRARPNAGAR